MYRKAGLGRKLKYAPGSSYVTEVTEEACDDTRPPTKTRCRAAKHPKYNQLGRQ